MNQLTIRYDEDEQDLEELFKHILTQIKHKKKSGLYPVWVLEEISDELN